MAAEPAPLLQIRGLHKRYAAPVLLDVDLALQPGEVHALVGANGAGKSTLARIVSGLTAPNAGAMRLEGRPYAPRSKAEAERAGVQMVMQELSLVGTLSVAENLFIDRLPRRLGFVDYARLHAMAREALAAVGLDAIDPAMPVSRLGVGQQQLVEIAAALARPCRLLLLDEPTAALTDPEIDLLFAHIRRLKAEGVGVIYVSHRMEELRRITDRVTVLRDGRVVETQPTAALPTDRIVELMVGRELVELCSLRQALAEFHRLGAEGFIGQRLEVLLEPAGLLGLGAIAAHDAFAAAAKNTRQILEHWPLEPRSWQPEKGEATGEGFKPPRVRSNGDFTIDGDRLPAGRAGARSGVDELQRIDVPAVLQHLEVHMRPGGTARGAHQGDSLAAADPLAHFDQRLLVVGIAGDIFAVLDLDQVAVAGNTLDAGDHALGHRQHL